MSRQEKKTIFVYATILIVVILVAFLIGQRSRQTLRFNCHNVGGELVVIDQRMSGKTTVDIYGCVNPMKGK